MTDLQIERVYNHPTDADGRLIAPKPPRAAESRRATLEEKLAAAEAAMAGVGAPAEDVRAALAVIRKAHEEGG